MVTDAGDRVRDLELIGRAQAGDHDAFVALYRQDAPPAWRLAVALTADADLAADAVGRAFARTLAPPRAGAVRTEVAFRQRLLVDTRTVVIDQATAARSGASALAVAAPPDPADPHDTRAQLGAEVMQAFRELPERWRTVLWLLVVEGLGTADAGRVLGVDEADAEELAVRAFAGLRAQWIRDRMAAGDGEPVAPDHLERHLHTVVPLPPDLFAIADGRWRAARVPSPAPLLLPLPGGRQLPRWAERSLVATTAALIALGITSALAIDRDPDVQRARRGETASGATTTTLGGHGDVGSNEGRGELAPTAPADDALADIDPALIQARGTTSTTRGDVRASASGSATPAGSGGAGGTGRAGNGDDPSSTSTTQPPSTTTTAEPALEITAGIGPALALSLGDQCTGIQVLGTPIGCTPDPDTGVTLEGSLLP